VKRIGAVRSRAQGWIPLRFDSEDRGLARGCRLGGHRDDPVVENPAKRLRSPRTKNELWPTGCSSTESRNAWGALYVEAAAGVLGVRAEVLARSIIVLARAKPWRSLQLERPASRSTFPDIKGAALWWTATDRRMPRTSIARRASIACAWKRTVLTQERTFEPGWAKRRGWRCGTPSTLRSGDDRRSHAGRGRVARPGSERRHSIPVNRSRSICSRRTLEAKKDGYQPHHRAAHLGRRARKDVVVALDKAVLAGAHRMMSW
jgi:hypothetical protein